MSTRQLNLSDFAEHCLDEINTLQKGGGVLELISSGKVVAVVNPAPANTDNSLENWIQSGEKSQGSPTAEAEDAWAQDIWHPLTVEQHALLQGIPVVTRVEDLLGDGTAEEWKGFDEALEQWRADQKVTPFEEEAPAHAA